MMSQNVVSITGRLGEDPKLNFLPNSGAAACEFSLAYQRRKQDEHGQWVDGELHWFRIKVFGKLAECTARLTKGTLIRVDGRLVQETWTVGEDEKRHQVKVVADSESLPVNNGSDIECTKGYLSMTWGNKRQPAVNNGVEDAVYGDYRPEPSWGSSTPEGPGF